MSSEPRDNNTLPDLRYIRELAKVFRQYDLDEIEIENGEQRVLGPSTLEVAILDANRPRRAFRRITGANLEALLPQQDQPAEPAPE